MLIGLPETKISLELFTIADCYRNIVDRKSVAFMITEIFFPNHPMTKLVAETGVTPAKHESPFMTATKMYNLGHTRKLTRTEAADFLRAQEKIRAIRNANTLRLSKALGEPRRAEI